MCSNCHDILQDFETQHFQHQCPLRNTRYCSYCAKSGHITKMCPAKPAFREPTYLEQLVPPSYLKEFNITSKTPLNYKLEEPQQLIEIKDNDKLIVAYLSARSIKSVAKDARQKLEEYSKLHNKCVVYIM